MCGCLISITEEKETNLNMGTETIYKLIFERFEEDEKEKRSKSDSEVSYKSASPENT